MNLNTIYHKYKFIKSNKITNLHTIINIYIWKITKCIILIKCTVTVIPLCKPLYGVLAKLKLDFSLFIQKWSL